MDISGVKPVNARLSATQYVWTAFAIAIGLLLVSSIFTAGGLSVGHIILGCVIAGAAFLSTAVMWGSDYTDRAHEENKAEKNKRRNIEEILGRLSDHDLEQLRDRLSDLNEDSYHGVSDDGELVKRR